MLTNSRKRRSDNQFKNIYQREAERKLRKRARMTRVKSFQNVTLDELSRGSRLQKIDQIISQKLTRNGGKDSPFLVEGNLKIQIKVCNNRAQEDQEMM